jgi:alpha-beta hydrolase superfamily lysophospholipase
MASSATIERIPTADGARLAVKRYAAPGATPVVLFHGLAVNADMWDLPEVRTTDFHYRSLTSLLVERGYDVWLVNFRGHGRPRMLSAPPPDATDWCVDDFILRDAPAVLANIAERSDRRPFVIGQSMGAMTLAAYLSGAEQDAGGGIRCAPAAAIARQAAVAGAVLVEFPAALRWPQGLYDAAGKLRWQALFGELSRTENPTNFPFEIAARLPWLEAMIVAVGGVPTDKLRPNGWGEEVLRRLPGPLAERWRSFEKRVVELGLGAFGTFSGQSHHRAEVLIRGRRYVIEEMKAGVLRQMAKCVRQGRFVSLLGEPECVYSDNYPHIALPLLTIVGGRDRIANAEVARTAFFDRVASADKTWRCYDTMGHGEFEAAPIATEQVYPDLLAWLADRDTPGPSA